MTTGLLLALAAFSFVASVSPGPNNAMVLASGATFGFRRTLPHLLGICGGLIVMVIAVGLGLGAAFRAVPWLYGVLQVVGVAYLLLLAWRIAHAAGLGGNAAASQPLGAVGAAAFQWVNPKAWVTIVALLTAYAPERHYLVNVLAVAAVFAGVAFVSVSLWAAFGTALARRLRSPEQLLLVNRGMAVLLVLSLVPLAVGV